MFTNPLVIKLHFAVRSDSTIANWKAWTICPCFSISFEKVEYNIDSSDYVFARSVASSVREKRPVFFLAMTANLKRRSTHILFLPRVFSPLMLPKTFPELPKFPELPPIVESGRSTSWFPLLANVLPRDTEDRGSKLTGLHTACTKGWTAYFLWRYVRVRLCMCMCMCLRAHCL